MKVLTIGDPHFKVNNLDEVSIFINKIVNLIKKLQPDLTVVLGDVFHTHEKKHVLVEKAVTKFLKHIVKYSLVYLIVGNHDMINCQQFLTANHSFTAYKYWEGLVICDKPKKLVLKDKTFIFVPYVPTGRFIEALDTLETDWRSADCIFAHQEIYNCRFNPVLTSEHGDKWKKKYPLLISGHIHDEQWVGKNVYYPGSCMQHGYSENADKIVALITFEEDFEIERIDLGLSKKRIVYIDISDIEKLKELKDKSNTKVVIKGEPESIKSTRKRKDYSDLTDGLKISFIPKDIVTKTVEKKSMLTILKDIIVDDDESVKTALEVLLEK